MPALNRELTAVFECVERHRAFARAAREMTIQQPTMNRRVQTRRGCFSCLIPGADDNASAIAFHDRRSDIGWHCDCVGC